MLEWGGDQTVGDRYFIVYMYRNDGDEENEIRNAIVDGLSNVATDLLDYGAIDFYRLAMVDDFIYGDDSDKDAFWSDFKSFMNSKEYHTDHIGCHMGVGSAFYGGYANASDYGSNSFNDGKLAITGINHAKQQFKNVAIHEVLHTFLDNNLSGIESDIEDGTEHDLGKVYDSTGGLSPMGTGYVNSHADHGTCSTDAWRLGYTTEITDCTLDGVQETANTYKG